MKTSLILLFTILCCVPTLSGSPENPDTGENPVTKVEAEKIAFIRILTEQLSADLISADAGWEVFSNLADGSLRDRLFIYINILSELQKIDAKKSGYRICIKGAFIRDCSTVLFVPNDKLLAKFSAKKSPNKSDECAYIDSRALFLSLHDIDIEALKEKK